MIRPHVPVDTPVAEPAQRAGLCMAARSSAGALAQGMWTDGRWCFSAGLDQRLRTWRLAAPCALSSTPSARARHAEPDGIPAEGGLSRADACHAEPDGGADNVCLPHLGLASRRRPDSGQDGSACEDAAPCESAGAGLEPSVHVAEAGRGGCLLEEGPSMALQVLEPSALAAARCAGGCYCVVVAGRGLQVLHASMFRDTMHAADVGTL
jgi:hypothetical protein